MKEYFQLFSGPMVRAILEGRKDMTRRLVTPENSLIDGKSARTKEGRALWAKLDWSAASTLKPTAVAVREDPLGHADFEAYWEVPEKFVDPQGGWPVHIVSPYVRMGDVLIGKETFFDVRPFRSAPLFVAVEGDFIYGADYEYREKDRRVIGCHPWRPSIFMPKEASRLRLEMVDTFPQRLQDISAEDCRREGIRWLADLEGYASDQEGRHFHGSDPRRSYEHLWSGLNEKPGTRWADNPPVWVRTFKRL